MQQRPSRRLRPLSLMACCLASASALHAAEAPSSFPFTIPWDDQQRGTATDVSFLNHVPAGSNGFILTRNGHFIQEKTGEPIRFFGTNFVGKANFPSHEDAAKIARHLAKYGINLVRLHHMDNDWDLKSGTGIWRPGDRKRQELSPDQLDKLDYLIAQLKEQGIYVNVNLKVSKHLSAADGLDPAIAKITFNHQKRVDLFNRRMIDLQKDYARRLLAHVNPYTGLTYAADPAVAIVEINNENSLVGDPWDTPGAGLNKLPEPFSTELAQLWNQWLKRKYAGSDAQLAKAWASDTSTTLPPAISADSKWILGVQGSAKADMVLTGEAANASGKSADVTIKHIDGTDYHVQLHMLPIQLKPDQPYTLKFSAKASVNRNARVAVVRDRDDFRNNGLAQSLKLTTEWKDFSFGFMPQEIDPGHTRVTFTMGMMPSAFSVRDLRIEPGAAEAGLQSDQSLAKSNIPLPTVMSAGQRRDWLHFLTDTEHAFALEIRQYLRDDLHVRVSMIDSQITWGALTGFEREADMEFADGHEYWQHPSFVGGNWDTKNWHIGNSPMVAAWAKGDKGTLDSLALTRVAGKPFSVSEYDHAAPSDFACEMMPLLSTFAAVQDWDAIYTFDYGQYGTGAPNNQVTAFFDQHTHMAKFPFYPAAAAIFRMQLLQPAAALRTLQLPPHPFDRWTQTRTVWQLAGAPLRPSDFFNHRWAVDPAAGAAEPKILDTSAAEKSATDVRLDRTSAGAVFIAHSPKAVVITGYVGGQTIRAGDTAITFEPFPGNFASAMLTAMDGQDLRDSRRVLLTLVGRAENQNMGWNASRTSVGEKWGKGPMLVQGITATVAMTTSGPRRITALTGTGEPGRGLPVTGSGGALVFVIKPDNATTWYAITGE